MSNSEQIFKKIYKTITSKENKIPLALYEYMNQAFQAAE